MPRVILHPEMRRAELLDHAMALFLEHGYENVSLNDIIAHAGTSKGAFYNCFDSKEALLTALSERSAKQAFAELKGVFTEPGKNALERLNAGLQAGYDVKVAMGVPEQLAAMAVLFRPENLSLYRRIVGASEDLFRPLLTEVISQGVKEGTFHTFDPEGVGDMIQGFAASTRSNIAQVLNAENEDERNRAVDVLVRRFKLYALATDRILGLPDGSVTALNRSQVETLVAALPRKYAKERSSRRK